MTSGTLSAMNRAAVLCCAVLVASCASEPPPERKLQTIRAPLEAWCTAQVNGVGAVDVETDYIAHVVQCENGAAPLEALKAQAVSARSYLYYKMDTSGSIADGTSDQVYSCGATPGAKHIQAAQETAGQVLQYQGVQVAAFYVAGAVPSAADCVAKPGDNDYSNTEKWVTYNWGKSGAGLTQTPLGWVNQGNKANRGCKSQNGAACLSNAGWKYPDILNFYYGMDIELVQATGPCVTPPDPPVECECEPGDTQVVACEACEERTYTCQENCLWSEPSACVPPAIAGEISVLEAPESAPSGEVVTVTLLVKNSGTSDWAEGAMNVVAEGDMHADSWASPDTVVVLPTVPAGAELSLPIEARMPATGGGFETFRLAHQDVEVVTCTAPVTTLVIAVGQTEGTDTGTDSGTGTDVDGGGVDGGDGNGGTDAGEPGDGTGTDVDPADDKLGGRGDGGPLPVSGGAKGITSTSSGGCQTTARPSTAPLLLFLLLFAMVARREQPAQAHRE